MKLIIPRDRIAGEENAFDEFAFRTNRPDAREVRPDGPAHLTHLVAGDASALPCREVSGPSFRAATPSRFLGPGIELRLLGRGGSQGRVKRWLHDFEDGAGPLGEGDAHLIGLERAELRRLREGRRDLLPLLGSVLSLIPQEVPLLNRSGLHEHREIAFQLGRRERRFRQAASGFNPWAGLTSVRN